MNWAKYPNKVCSPKKDNKNIASNKIIKPTLPGLDFANLMLLKNPIHLFLKIPFWTAFFFIIFCFIRND